MPDHAILLFLLAMKSGEHVNEEHEDDLQTSLHKDSQPEQMQVESMLANHSDVNAIKRMTEEREMQRRRLQERNNTAIDKRRKLMEKMRKPANVITTAAPHPPKTDSCHLSIRVNCQMRC